MKIKHILTLLGVSFSLAAVGAVGVASGAGEFGQDDLVAEVKATGSSGTITIDTTDGSWALNDSDGNGQNFSIYFYNNTTSGWGSYVHGAHQQYMVNVPYDLNFVPTKMIAVRYSPWVAESGTDSWTSNPWRSNTWGKWNQTVDLTFTDNANIVIGDWNDTEKKNDAQVLMPYLYGVPNNSQWDTWAKICDFTGAKVNGSNHAEYYLTKTFVQYEKFGVKLYSGDWINTISLSKFVDDDAFEVKSNNIECNVPGKYALYYDRNSASVFITDPVAAAADEWAQTFLATGCTTASTGTKAKWGTHASSYGSLDSEVKALFVAETHVDHDAATTTYLAAAVQRYDYVLQRYGVNAGNTDELGYSDFMGRVGGKLSLTKVSFNGGLNNPSNSSVFVVVLVSTIALVTLGGFVVIRKRKQEN